MRRRSCLALDLRDDAAAISEYERIHRPGGVWPEVIADLRARGYTGMTIWRTGNRLFMIADIDTTAVAPATEPRVQQVLDRWQELTSGLQQALPGTGPRPQWTEMACVFDLDDHHGEAAGEGM
jgi:L-rhamnose mutarotase